MVINDLHATHFICTLTSEMSHATRDGIAQFGMRGCVL